MESLNSHLSITALTMSLPFRVTAGGLITLALTCGPFICMRYLGDPPAVDEARRQRWIATRKAREERQAQKVEAAADKIFQISQTVEGKNPELSKVGISDPQAGHLTEANGTAPIPTAWEKIRARNEKQ